MRLLLIASCLVAAPLWADGFEQTDLSQIDPSLAAFSGGVYDAGAAPDRLTIYCTDCSDQVAIDVLMGQSTDGTEGRYRSGETTIEKMEAICKSRSPTCELEAVETGAAVGWITQYEIGGDTKGSTVVLFQDGDMLTIRSIAKDRETADRNAAVSLKMLAPQIVGD
jgi:hypothetical protein